MMNSIAETTRVHRPHNLTRRQALRCVAGAAAVAVAGSARAAFPADKPIKIVVPWAAGGSTDAVARALAQRLGETLSQSVIVDNKPGAAGQIGTDAVAKAAPDGYTLGIVELPHVIAPAVVARLPYDVLRDFAPVTLVGTSPLILFAGVAPDTANLGTFVKAAGSGRFNLSLAHSGSGSSSHLAAAMFAEQARVRADLVPYKGSAPALTDVAAGIVSGHFATMASGSSLLGAGKLRAMAAASRRRLEVTGLRQIPTFAELGYKDFELNQWWALVAPATTPTEVLEKLRSQTLEAMTNARALERLSSLGIDLKGSTRDEARAFMRSEAARWQMAAKRVGLVPQ